MGENDVAQEVEAVLDELGKDSQGEPIYLGDFARIDEFMVKFIGDHNLYFNEMLNEDELSERMHLLEERHPNLDYAHFTKITPEEAGAV